jgi:hypothetical protein
MDQYEYTQDPARAGLAFGIEYEAEAKVVPSGVTFEFGEPVFVDEGVEDVGYAGDSNDASLKFLGVTMISHRSYNDSEEQYVAYQDMNVLTEGVIYVPVASGITNCANQAAYVIDDQSSGDYNKFTTTSGSNYDIGGYFRSNANADGLARVELRGLK